MVRKRMHDQGLFGRSSKKPHNQRLHFTHTRTYHIFRNTEVRKVLIGERAQRLHHKFNTEDSRQVLYLQFPGFKRRGGQLVHGVFTRQGGVSEAPYDTLNSSYSTGDTPECVSRNLQIIKEALCAEHLVFMNQMHGKKMLVLRRDNFQDFREPSNVDALITDIPYLALMVKQADCQGVILYDPLKGVVSNVHCGWRGNTHDILGSVVGRMRSEFGCRESDVMAAIGPSLGPCCAQFSTHEQIFSEWFRRFMVREGYFDLWEISRWQLLEAGLKEEHIEVAGICTSCRTDIFYSYRAEGTTGRFATVAMLKSRQDSEGSC